VHGGMAPGVVSVVGVSAIFIFKFDVETRTNWPIGVGKALNAEDTEIAVKMLSLKYIFNFLFSLLT
jgi:hypothetical protein